MYVIKAETIITGDINRIWELTTDVSNWPNWDPHEEEGRLDGPFVVGSVGWSKPRKGPGTEWIITEVVPKRVWASECKLPGGKLTGRNTFTPLGDGRIACTKEIHVSGPLIPLFRFYFGKHIKRDMFATWGALEQEATNK